MPRALPQSLTSTEPHRRGSAAGPVVAVRCFLGRFGRESRGVAALEMALVTGVLATGLMNGLEVGRYAYMSAQVGAAAQAGAQAAIATCDTNHTPATINCTGLSSSVTTAIHGTSLGSDVSVKGQIQEDWFCLTNAGVLQNIGAASSSPTDCLVAGSPNLKPALYLRVSTQYTYDPLFPGLTLADIFADDIVRTAWMRMR